MSRLIWDSVADRRYASGTDRGVFYTRNGVGEVWNGLVSVEESPSGELRHNYLDGLKFSKHQKKAEYSATLKAYTYPTSMSDYLGMYTAARVRRRNKPFHLSYRVMTTTGYEVHVVYNVSALPSQINHEHDSTETFGWEIESRGVPVFDDRTSSHLIVDSAIAHPDALAEFESVIYGAEFAPALLPDPPDLLNIFERYSELRVTDHGDGTFTVTGPDTAVKMLDSTTFEIDWPSVVILDPTTYRISSW